MRVIAVMLIGRNTFLSMELENTDDSRETVEQDARELADRLGATFLYFEDIE